jgi:hypothetical protein
MDVGAETRSLPQILAEVESATAKTIVMETAAIHSIGAGGVNRVFRGRRGADWPPPSLSANTDAALFHNPKCPHNWLLGQEIQHSLDGRRHRNMRLIGQPEHDDAREIGWWVSEDVGKIQV